MMVAQLRGRRARSLALLVGVLVATTGFALLTGSTETSQLRVTGDINANYRAAYDILVRPKGARAALEDERGLVRPNYLSGLFGGISEAEYARVRAVSGVDVAAPIATLGYVTSYRQFILDLTDYVDRSATRQLLRLDPTWLADRGLTVIDDTPQYVYLSRQPMFPVALGGQAGNGEVVYSDGTRRRYDETCPGRPLEQLEDGSKVPVCGTSSLIAEPTATGGATGLDEADRSVFTPYQLLADGSFLNRNLADFKGGAPLKSQTRLLVPVTWRVIMSAAAIDPEQEARLVGLDHAVVSGRYLEPTDGPATMRLRGVPAGVDGSYTSVPVLTAVRPYLDENIRVGVERVDPAGAAAVPGAKPTQLLPKLRDTPGTKVGSVLRAPGDVAPSDAEDKLGTSLNLLIQSGPTTYDVGSAGDLRPKVVPNTPEVWREPLQSVESSIVGTVPLFATDTAVRTLSQTTVPLAGHIIAADAVGVFDPDQLTGFSELGRVPLETYQAPQADGADERSTQLLGGQPLRPNSNPAGYLASPPLLLTTLAAVHDLMPSSDAPISAIRVRVAGVTAFDAENRERIRLVAERIATATGLDVDITTGSSLAPQTVVLPAGRYGRPELRLTEGWSKKGVAVEIIRAIDRKTLILFGLILVVCVLFLANATSAAVRDRRRELAVLACVGWSRRRLAMLVAGEVAIVGALAGTLSAIVALPLASLVGVDITWQRALLALPVALGLALVAAVFPAWRASRAHPATGLTPTVVRARRARGRRRTVFGLAARNLLRVPGRGLLAVVALAVGVGALSLLAAVTWGFHGEVTGTLLGDAISLRVRGVDAAAVVTIAVLAALCVADVLYLNIRDRAGELAALTATGWSDAALARLVVYEGLGLGVLGAVIGAGIGLLAVNDFVGTASPAVVRATVVAGAAGIGLAGLAALVPALFARRLNVSALLAEE